ncbi:MAG: hypothetical protein EXR83_14810 [Gammaproteobacteria bacterium]|nr:hypothetical protein [Gammaproteobacteria bacterium]
METSARRNTDLLARTQDMAARARQTTDHVRGQVIQLPLWPDQVRGLPNVLARSALFNVANRTVSREYYKKTIISSLRGIEITYTGEELRQSDEDVWAQILHLARLSPLGEWVEFGAYGMMKALGWPTNSRSYTRLREAIERLSATNLSISLDGGRKGYGGSLVRKFVWGDLNDGEHSRRWRVWLEKDIVHLFGPVSYTHVDWKQRLALPPLAKWLHAFYFTHREPVNYKVETLRLLCGSDSKQLFHFRAKLRHALELLKEVGFLDGWHLDVATDNVRVVRRGRLLA